MRTAEVLQYLNSNYFNEMIESMTSELNHMSPSEYIESVRILPDSVSSKPGPYRFDVNPFMREIFDCIGNRGWAASVREINVCKGVQLTYTTILENIILYGACYKKTVPMQLFMTTDEAVKKRIETYVLPAFQHSNLDHVIQSNDLNTNTRKSGQKQGLMYFMGGGRLISSGVQTSQALRSDSSEWLLKDELDSWKDILDGCPDRVSDDRASSYWNRRKILRGSTPLEKETSKIWKRYLQGDQRKYFVPCIHCGFMQEIRMSGVNKENGIEFGFKWDYNEDGSLSDDSVRYICKNCGGEWYEHHKPKLFATESGAEWRPTANPKKEGVRSYQIPAFFSPQGMQSWAKSIATYIDAHDKDGQIKDFKVYKQFYNNVLGMPFEMKNDRMKPRTLYSHRRNAYQLGDIPNNYSIEHAGSKIHILTCAVDVHGENLRVAVYGHASNKRIFQIEDLTFKGDTSDYQKGPWIELENLISKRYVSDTGDEYDIELTFVDSGYRQDAAVSFCMQYETGVIPIIGRDRPGKAQTITEFGPFMTKLGMQGMKIIVDIYKDRISTIMRKVWTEGAKEMPYDFYSAPFNMTDEGMKEFCGEHRRQVVDASNNVKGYEWHRTGPNESLDLLVYNLCALDVIAQQLMMDHFEQESVNFNDFWRYLEESEHFIKNGKEVDE